MSPGIELTPEELARALSLRPKVPLTAQEQAGLLEMLEWFEEQKEELAKAQLRREVWQKRFPIIFTGISTVIGIIVAAFQLFVKR